MSNFQINNEVIYLGIDRRYGYPAKVICVDPDATGRTVFIRFDDGYTMWCNPLELQEKVPTVAQGRASEQAFKADAGKPNWYLLMSAKGCAKALAGVVRVLSFAVAPKPEGKGYTAHSWREVPNAEERYQAALYRHLNKIELGESVDDESKESHWYHVATNALFLAELHNKGNAK